MCQYVYNSNQNAPFYFDLGICHVFCLFQRCHEMLLSKSLSFQLTLSANDATTTDSIKTSGQNPKKFWPQKVRTYFYLQALLFSTLRSYVHALFRAWQINGINNTNRINNRFINQCKLGSGLIQINNRM